MSENKNRKKDKKAGGLTSGDIVKLMKGLESVELTFDQLYYYEQTGLIVPSIKSSQGRGIPRLYSVEDFIILRWLVQLNKNGVHLNQFREVISFLRKKMPGVLKNPQNWVLITEGKSIKFFDKINSKTLDIIENSAQYLFVFPIGKIAEESRSEAKNLKS